MSDVDRLVKEVTEPIIASLREEIAKIDVSRFVEERKAVTRLVVAGQEMLKSFPHLGSCCTVGGVLHNKVTDESCKCEPRVKELRAALAAFEGRDGG